MITEGFLSIVLPLCLVLWSSCTSFACQTVCEPILHHDLPSLPEQDSLRGQFIGVSGNSITETQQERNEQTE